MELDELKQLWQNEPVKNNTNTDIMQLIQRKDEGPLTELKSTYRKQMVLMATIPFVLIATNARDLDKVFTSILFWSYVAFCVATILFARYNYQIVKEMQLMDGLVKSNLEQQIALLEKRAKMEIVYLRAVLIFFAILVEVLPYFQHYVMLDLWHKLPFLVRISAYGGLFLLQYVLNKRLKERRVGRHLTHLKEVIGQMQ